MPSLATLCRAIEQHTAPLYLIVCLPENHIPDFPLSNHPSELEGRLNNRFRSSHEMSSVQQRQCFGKPIA